MSMRLAQWRAWHENDALLVLARSAGSRARQGETFVDARNAGFENMMRARSAGKSLRRPRGLGCERQRIRFRIQRNGFS